MECARVAGGRGAVVPPAGRGSLEHPSMRANPDKPTASTGFLERSHSLDFPSLVAGFGPS